MERMAITESSSSSAQDHSQPSVGTSPPKPKLDPDSDFDSDVEDPTLTESLISINGSKIFKLVKDIDPSVCSVCVNIICALVDEGTIKAIRSPGKVSESLLLHHKTLGDLLKCSTTCHLCALFCHLMKMDALGLDVNGRKISSSKEVNRPVDKLSDTSSLKLLGERDTSMWNLKPDQTYGFKQQHGYRGQTVAIGLVYPVYSAYETDDPYDAYQTNRYGARVYTSHDDPLSKKHLGRPVQPNANCPETLGFIKHFVETCVHDHPECEWSKSASGEDPFLPYRVIDIGPYIDSVPRILVSVSKRAKWVALSHRWGEVDFLRLTKSNLQEMENGIDHGALPATFQDAIVLTRHLGLRYLWVDSLCIIQDSPEDWLKEAAKMPNIYRNAYVTIAAAATEDSTAGIFVDRVWKPTSRPSKLPIPFGQLHGTIHFDIPFDNNPSHEEVNYLRDRAWCFQESQLSHRILTFDRLQVSYTCVRHGLVESRELPDVLAREGKNTFLSQFQSPLTANDPARRRALVFSWYNLLFDYTRRELTFSNDKLVAISGVANVIGNCINDEYYAGLWRNDMPLSLLWSPYEEELLPNPLHKASLPPIYRAPSWSWASVDGPISCFLCREKAPQPPIATIVEVRTTLVGPDTYGQVKAGFLKISAPLRRAVGGKCLPTWPEQPRICWDIEVDDEDDITHGIYDIGWPEEAQNGTHLWCLQITARYGLILIETGENEGEYSRIGIFHLWTRARKNPEWFTPTDVTTVTIV